MIKAVCTHLININVGEGAAFMAQSAFRDPTLSIFCVRNVFTTLALGTYLSHRTAIPKREQISAKARISENVWLSPLRNPIYPGSLHSETASLYPISKVMAKSLASPNYPPYRHTKRICSSLPISSVPEKTGCQVLSMDHI